MKEIDSNLQEVLDKMYSLDDYSYNISDASTTKVCPLCRKPFYGEGKSSSRQIYCKRTHVINCAVCGKPVKQKQPRLSIDSICQTCSPACASILKHQKSAQTIKEKYGCDNISQCEEFKDKISQGIKAKSAQITQHRVETLTKLYGGSGTASPVIRAKIEATMKERYGVSNPSFSSEFRQKISEVLSSPETIAKYEETCMARWGVRRPSMLPEIQDKMKQTCLDKYGVECALRSEFAKERFTQASMDKYGVPNPLLADSVKELSRQGFLNHLHDTNSKISKVNQQVAATLQSCYNIETEFEHYIAGKWFDLHVVNSNIVLEIDPSYTHSAVANHWAEGKSSDYHLSRSILAEEAGYRCIHIFEWDDPDKIGKMLQARKKVYARKCILRQLKPKDIHSFIDTNHLQGDVKGAQYVCGLYFDDELVQVMTFGQPRYNKKYQWELLRLCTKQGVEVVGGPSKLFKQFIKDTDPDSIISYCDRAKFTGSVYDVLGFTLAYESSPAKVWSKGTYYVTDNLLRQRGFDQLFGTNYGKGTSNEVLMIEDGWLPVYDCGQKVFEWKSST